jgi:hypothetical protein
LGHPNYASYFFVSHFSQNIFSPVLIPVLRSDPILLSLILIMIFTLIKPIGGIMLGIAFWNISRTVSFEKTLRDYMIISGYGFFYYSVQIINFSCTRTISTFRYYNYNNFDYWRIFDMIGIYKFATLVSTNTDLRISIHEIAKES